MNEILNQIKHCIIIIWSIKFGLKENFNKMEKYTFWWLNLYSENQFNACW